MSNANTMLDNANARIEVYASKRGDRVYVDIDNSDDGTYLYLTVEQAVEFKRLLKKHIKRARKRTS